MPYNIYLLIAAGLNFAAAFTHILIIYFGAPWYRFFGAGEHMAQMAEKGSLQPTLITLFIAGVLSVFGIYALVGAGVRIPVPFAKPILIMITMVFFVRGLAVIPVLRPSEQLPSPEFWLWSSVTVVIYGIFHVIGLIQVWSKL